MNLPIVSVIIPCFNEERTILKLLEAIYHQTYPLVKLEVVIADGLSTDSTRAIISEFAMRNPSFQIKVVDNPNKIIPAALNLAIVNASGEVLTRMDAHAVPAPDYIEKSVTALLAGLGENVGGVIDVKPGVNTWIGRSIAVAVAHPMGVGDAKYRWTTKATEADTVAFGSYWRSYIKKIGQYNENLLVNEDYELNSRIRAAGGKIWIDPDIRADYYSRPDLVSLAHQYFTYGYWKFKMLLQNPKTLRLRQAAPPLFIFGILMLLLLSLFWNIARICLVLLIGVYLITLIAGSIKSAVIQKSGALLIGIPLAILTMHFSWGAGLWVSLIRFICSGK